MFGGIGRVVVTAPSEVTRVAGLPNYGLVDEIDAKYRSLPFDDQAARDYAVIRANLSRAGNPIGPKRHADCGYCAEPRGNAGDAQYD